MKHKPNASNSDDMDNFDYDFFPDSIKSIAEIIGVDEARNIVKMLAKRGRRDKVYIAEHPTDNSIFKGVVSDESLHKIHAAFKGDKLDLTTCKNWQKVQSKMMMHQLKSKQYSPKDIAKKTGVHIATVYRELARRRGEV